jgi:osmotically-inducible protein OsmY
MKGHTDITGTELKMDVLAELRYEPSVKITDIGVLVKDEAVTLNGYATSYCEKCDAVRAARCVCKVHDVKAAPVQFAVVFHLSASSKADSKTS